MKKNLILVILTMLWVIPAFSQIPQRPNKKDATGKKQGPWTILYNADWDVIQNPDSAAFYRLITYKNDLPAGVTRDYFRNGHVQWEGKIVQEEPQVLDGPIVEYAEAGFIQDYSFYTNGKSDPQQTVTHLRKQIEEERTTKPEHLADLLNTLGVKLEAIGEFENALKAYEESLSVLQKSGNEKELYLSVLYNTAGLNYLMRNYEGMKRWMSNVLPASEKFYGHQSAAYAEELVRIAGMNLIIGEVKNAEGYELEALSIHEKVSGKDSPAYAEMLHTLAFMYYQIGNLQKSESFALESLRLKGKLFGKESITYLLTMNQLGWTYNAMGEHGKAEPLFREYARVAGRVLGKTHPNYATAVNSLAVLYYTVGNYSKAELLMQEAASIVLQNVGSEHHDYGVVMGNLGVMYLKTNKLKLAEESTLAAMKIFEREDGVEHPEYVKQQANLSRLYKTQGKYARAEALLKEVIAYRETKVDAFNPDYITSLNHMAQLYEAMGKEAEARKFFQRGNVSRHYLNEAFLEAHANFYGDRRYFQQADSLYKRATEIRLRKVKENFVVMSEQEREAFYQATLADYLNNYNSFVATNYQKRPALTGEMYDLQLATKAVLLNNSAKWKQRIRQSGDVKLFSLYQEWESLTRQLAKAETGGTPQESIAIIRAQAEELEKTLTKRSELFAKSIDRKVYSWKDIAGKLAKDEASVEIIRFRKRGIARIVIDSSDVNFTRYPKHDLTDTIQYAVLIVKQNSKNPDLVLLDNGNQLEGKFLMNYQNSIKGQVEDNLSYDQFWSRIASGLKGVRKVHLSADGAFHRINVNVLKNPKTGKFVLDETEIFLVTNTKDLLQPPAEQGENRYALLMGMPDFGLSAELQSEQAKVNAERMRTGQGLERSIENLTELPGTREEVERIAGLLNVQGWQTDVFLRENALEENIKDAFKPAVLHIATHGYFKSDFDAINPGGNPLLQSGLVLAGAGNLRDRSASDDVIANKIPEDGILTAYEAMNLNLDNTEVVVLSACETGLGEIKNGEGVYGLQRAFTVAGSRSIVMSLWKVNDQTTQELMVAFYTRWLEGATRHEAFRHAQLEVRKKHKDPYHWGAFVMIGDQ